MSNAAPTDYDIHPLLATRWSPYGFQTSTVDRATICALFEAARWAPSSYNEQPWAFLVAERNQAAAFEAMLGCLVEANRQWAQNASLLAISVAHTEFSRNGKPNRHAMHDVGLAVASLTFEATARGLAVHQMAGFDVEAARSTYAIPDTWEPVTAIAIGLAAAPESLPQEFRERDSQRRPRKPLQEFLFSQQWQNPLGQQ